jgi:pSer/pThr/pTyr-binding forkhead associated (FHA) protein
MWVGTAPTCDVQVHGDEFMSGHHARIILDDGGQVWIEDLGSTNGTWIQRAGEPRREHPSMYERVLDKTRFRPGDTLWLSRKTALPWDRFG